MNTLTRFILKEHLRPFILGLALILFVLLMDVVLQMMDQVLSKGLTLTLAAQLLFYNMAWIIALAVPMSVLIAVLMAFARLASDNEILAAKACGIDFFHLLRPVLAAAAVLTVLMVLFNDRILPDWNHRARNLASSLRHRKAALALDQMEGVFIHDLGSYSLLIRQIDKQRNRLYGITVYDIGASKLPTSLHAPSGQLELLDNGAYLRLTLEEGEFYQFEADDPERFLYGSFHRQVIHIQDPERAFRRHSSTYRSDREMNIAAMRQTVRRHHQERQQSLGLMDSTVQALIDKWVAAEDSGIAFDFARELALTRQALDKERRLNANRTRMIDEFRVEIHKKFAIPVACLVFVLLGAPLGVAIRHRGAAVSIGVSLVFFWFYWIFLIGGEELADRGFIHPAVAMWAPNGLFGLIGLYLVRSAARDRSWPSFRRQGSRSR